MITDISVRAVRGIRSQLFLRLGEKAVVVHGGNGTGKSSLARALQWALTGQDAPPADDTAAGEERYRRHVLTAPSEPRVEVGFSDGSKIVVTPTTEQVEGAAAQFREACVRASPFLRRAQVLEVLAGRPIDRFRYLEGYLDLAQADALREELATRAAAENTRADAALQKHGRAAANVAAALPNQDAKRGFSSAAGIETALRAAAMQAGVAQSGSEPVDALVQRARGFVSGEGLAAKRARVVAAIRSLSAFAAMPDCPDLDAARAKVTQTEEAASESGLADLLSHAQKHFVAGQEGTKCPVCGQDVDRQGTISAIAARLASLTEYQDARRHLSQSISEWRSWWAAFLVAARDIRAALEVRSLTEVEGVPPPPPTADVLLKTNSAATDAEFGGALTVAEIRPVVDWVTRVVSFFAGMLDRTAESLPSEEATHAIRQFIQAAERYVENREQFVAAEQEQKEARAAAHSIGAVADALRKARQDVAKDLLTEIAGTVARYYSTIHPREAEEEITDSPEIVVQRQREGTAYIRGRFNGQKVDDPRWVYSDGHVDTVGICIFLALRRFSADRARSAKLLVLDDVISSVDLDHARNFVRLLRDEFKDHQVVLFTHNELFAHWCSGLAPGMRRVVIKGWTLEGGPRLGDYQSTIARLEAAIKEETSPKAISLLMMWLLDEWLLECRFVYQLAVPARRGEQYTLAELWAPFVKRLKATQSALGAPIPSLDPLLEQLKDVPRVRNMRAAHENEFAREFPLATMRSIATAAVSLVRRLYCFECDECAAPVPGVGENTEVLRCRGGHIVFAKDGGSREGALAGRASEPA
jgi:hypothetical protein